MNISMSEILVVLLVALLVIRPEQLPDVAQKLGGLVRTFKRAMQHLKQEFNALTDDKSPHT